MTIGRVIEGKNAEIVTCDVAATVREAIALLAKRRIGAMPVLEGGRVAGIFSERDVIYRLEQDGTALLERKVGEVMTQPAVTAERDMQVLHALSLMTKRRIRHLPVVENGELIGFVSIGDLVKNRMDRIESEAEALRSYIQTA